LGISIGDLISTSPLGRFDWLALTVVASGVWIFEEFRKLLVKLKFFVVGN
jgi:hypothetical protein